jgi:NADH dehydrogenase/NADH:ubiquinone oxidoreductase subunit G
MTAQVPEGFPKVKGETRPWECKKADETCTRSKPCASCRGARNRRSGMRKQREARKALERVTGAEAARFAGQLGNEEAWSGLPLRVEVKSGAQVGPIWTRYAAAENQANASKAIGDARPFVMVAMGQKTSDGLALVRLSELARFVEAVLNQ